MLYFLSAGEASGDLHASRLITALRKLDHDARFCFLGGDMMAAAADAKPVIHYRDMAYMGFSEVIKNLGKVRHNLLLASQLLRRLKPDVVILVDYPSFNLRIAKEAYSLGIPSYYYISPKVWAWKEYRVKDIRRYTRRVLSILPFEVPFYQRHGMTADYVGNPSVEEVDDKLKKLDELDNFLSRHNLTDKPIIALLPGSRTAEIKSNLPIMMEAARPLRKKYQMIVAGAPGIDPGLYRDITDATILFNSSFELLAHAKAALITSGTATLEAALTGTPQVVCYRSNGSRLTYALMKNILHVNFVSLPNLIVNKAIIPEMLLHECNPISILEQLLEILPGKPGRESQLNGYRKMRKILGTSNAADNAARLIYSDLKP